MFASENQLLLLKQKDPPNKLTTDEVISGHEL
jgi:hypothetical protein